MKYCKKQQGFTIVELIMATAVFSVVLLLGLTGFIQVGKMFYKGVTLSQTRDASTDILQTVSNDLKFASQVTSNANIVCIGNHRYTKNLNQKLSTADGPATNFALKRETFNNHADCLNTSVTPNATGSPELLQNNMRISRFDINQVGNPAQNLYSINIKVIYGDDEDLTSTDASAQCKGTSVGTQFCAVSELSSTVYRGLGDTR